MLLREGTLKRLLLDRCCWKGYLRAKGDDFWRLIWRRERFILGCFAIRKCEGYSYLLWWNL